MRQTVAMSGRHARWLEHPGPRHRVDWYDQSGEAIVLAEGDRLSIQCDGGPSGARMERFPPRLEIEDRGGLYVLEDIGPRDQWCYRFVPNDA